jgi:hypothetical protein
MKYIKGLGKLTQATQQQIYRLKLHKKMFFIYILKVKDLILITAHCPTNEQVERLEKCVDLVMKTNRHILLISHTHIPIHIQNKCQYYFYDYLNETSDDYELLGHNSFATSDFLIQSRFFQKTFYGFAIYRMFSMASQIAINFGYEKLHHIEYDCELLDESIIDEHSILLEKYDSILYTNDGTPDGFLFGSLKSFKVSSLPEMFKKYDRDCIENEMKNIEPTHLESLTKKIFINSGNILFKNENDLSNQRFNKGPKFDVIGVNYTLFYDSTNNTINIFYKSMKSYEEDIVVIVNDEVVRFTSMPNQWSIRVLGLIDEINYVRIDNSVKCLYEKTFDDEFKQVFVNKSYITFYEKNN